MKNKVFKIKDDTKELSLYFKQPNHDEVLVIDMEFRKIYSIAVRNEVITQAEAIKQYRKSGAWTIEDDADVSQTMLNLTLLEAVIGNDDKTKEEKREAALKAANLRSELLQKMNIRTGLFDHTAEAMAEQQKLHKFILLCTMNEADDNRLFETREEYQNFLNEHPDIGSEIYREAYFFDYELPDDISESWAEVQFLKEDLKEQTEKPKAKAKAKKRKKKTTKVRKK